MFGTFCMVEYSGQVDRVSHMKWVETKQQTVRQSNQLLLSFATFLV